MTDDTTNDMAPIAPGTDAAAEAKAQTPGHDNAPGRGWLAWIAAALCVAAWVMLHFNGVATAVLCALALVASIAALRQRRRAAHNLALTTLVASAVLALVLIIVAIAIRMLI